MRVALGVGWIAALALIAISAPPARARHTVFDFRVDRFEIDGNASGAHDGVADVVNEFDDFVIPWLRLYGTVYQSDGVLHLSSPGAHFPGPDGTLLDVSNVESWYQFLDGRGDLTVTAYWEPDIPHEGQLIHLTIFSGTLADGLDFVGLDFGHRTEQLGIQQHQTRYVGGTFEDTRTAVVPIDAADVTGQIVLRLRFDDATNLLTSFFSTDGGATFVSPFDRAPIFGSTTTAGFILGADPEAAPPTTTTTVTTTSSTTTVSTTIPRSPCEGDGASVGTIGINHTLLRFRGVGHDRFEAQGTFATDEAFDPTEAGSIVVRIVDTGSGILWESGPIMPGTPQWAKSNPRQRFFKWVDRQAAVVPGLTALVVKEKKPFGTGRYSLRVKGKRATLLGGSPTVGTHQLLLEFSGKSTCIRGTTVRCRKRPTRERCS